jgi:glycosyltransferase involved in cell wall biosynthesis
LQHQYLRQANLDRGIRGALTRYLLHRLRVNDLRGSFGVDHFVANSRFIAARIDKAYRRPASVVYPPVDVDKYTVSHSRKDYYLAASRLVPYKRMPLIAQAFARMPDKKLLLIGDGADADRINKIAAVAPNISVLGFQPPDRLAGYLAEARALVFAAQEDFGILLVEAQACGTPVIAYGSGGARENIIDGKTGLFFTEQSEEAIIQAVLRFEHSRFDPQDCRAHAERFSVPVFRHRMASVIASVLERRKTGSALTPDVLGRDVLLGDGL